MLSDWMMMIKEPLIVLALAVVFLPGVVRGLAMGADWLERRVEHNDRLRSILHRLG